MDSLTMYISQFVCSENYYQIVKLFLFFPLRQSMFNKQPCTKAAIFYYIIRFRRPVVSQLF